MPMIHFNMVVEINSLLKEKGMAYTLHALQGCSCNGVYLKQEGKKENIADIIQVINEYLKPKFMYVKSDEDNEWILNVYSILE